MINRVVLVGRLTRDPELRRTGNGTAVASFTVAVDNRTKDTNGNRTTSFIPCTVWGQSAENVSRFTRKGSLVGIEGRLNQRSYETKDNRKVTVVEVICDSVQFLERKPEEGAPLVETNEYEYQPKNDVVAETNNVEGIDIAEDDLPF
jgi:single-strand DNA-binding protein